jgi:uncharacterized membrane protein
MRLPRTSRHTARALGVFSVGLAAAQVVAPKRVARLAGVDGRGGDDGGGVKARAAVTIARPRDEVYAFWRQLENLPRFMIHLQSVEETGGGRSHWVGRAPAGKTVEWDAEITAEQPGKLIAWRSLPGSDIHNEGTVRFLDAPGKRGTEVHLELSYDAPLGALGDLLAKAWGEQPEQQVKDDLRRFKQVLETGEVVISEGSPRGLSASQQLHQRPARPFEPPPRQPTSSAA